MSHSHELYTSEKNIHFTYFIKEQITLYCHLTFAVKPRSEFGIIVMRFGPITSHVTILKCNTNKQQVYLQAYVNYILKNDVLYS